MDFDKCILCLKVLDSSTPPEHVIPHSLGGKLQSKLLCGKCNHDVGAKLYASIKFDSWVRKAVWELRSVLPEKIFEAVEKRQAYTTGSPTGVVLKAKKTNSDIRIEPSFRGTETVLPTQNATKYLEKKLIHDFGISSEIAKSLTSKVSATPNGEKVQIFKDLHIIKWDAQQFKPDFTGNGIPRKNAMVLIAFEYLALLLGKSIYNEAFNPIRESILNDLELVKVEFFISRKPQPFHLIYPEFASDKTVISIHLFEYSIAKVTFNKLKISNSPDFCYLEDLVKHMSLGAWSVVDAKANKWYEFDN